MFSRALVPCLALSVALASPARAIDMSLVGTLVSKLGVTQKQAEGGAGTILDYAKNNLSKDDFGKVASAIPETESLLKAVPKSEGSGSTLGAIGGALGGGSTLGTVAGLASLTGSFEKLGLSSDMVGKFIPVVLDYAQGKGGAAVSGILAKVLTPSSAPAATPAAAPAAAAPKAPEPTATAKVAPTATPKPAAKSSTKKKATPAPKAPAPTKPKS